jgi:hypothetical protein
MTTTLNPLRYPVDYTGVAPSNKVVAEPHALPAKTVRVFAPLQAPFFAKGLIITDTTTGQPLTSSQYMPYAMCTTASLIAGSGNESYNVIAITDQSVGNNVTVSYQTVGGNYLMGADALVLLLNALTLDTRPVNWPNILNAPPSFPSNQHLEAMSATIGFEYVVEAILRLAMTIVVGDAAKLDEVMAYLDLALSQSNAATSTMTAPGSVFGQHVLNTANPHGVTPTLLGLGHVLNYAVAQLSDVYTGSRTDLYVTVDQVAAVVKNAINLGMDAHILDVTTNPHHVTQAQIGLALLMNYATAALSDLQTPNVNNPLYVTNVVMSAYLTSFFNTQAATVATSIATVSTAAQTALTAANTALAAAQTAQQAASQATSQSGTAASQAASALTQAQANALAVTSSASAAQALVQQYTVAAVAAADTAGFSRGYAAGLAAAHS